MMWEWGFPGWWLLMALFMILFWGGIIALVVWLIVRFTRRGRESGTGTQALEIAKERYARGEISREEFERIKEDLV